MCFDPEQYRGPRERGIEHEHDDEDDLVAASPRCTSVVNSFL